MGGGHIGAGQWQTQKSLSKKIDIPTLSQEEKDNGVLCWISTISATP